MIHSLQKQQLFFFFAKLIESGEHTQYTHKF